MSTVDETTCIGGPRCLCQGCTDERMRKAIAPPRVTAITDMLDAEQTCRYLELAVDSLAIQKAVLVEENDALRGELAIRNGCMRSMERRVEQVLLHRWRSRIWSALLTAVVLLVHDGSFARWFS